MAGLFGTIRAGVALCVLAIGLAGCTAQIQNHGYTPSDDDLAGIIVGVDTRDSVAESVGSPTSGGVLTDTAYYYVSQQVRQFGFMAPQVLDRQVVAVSFDGAGVVRNIERFTLEDGRIVPLTQRVTDNTVQNTTFLRQLMGNLGRFDADTFLN